MTNKVDTLGHPLRDRSGHDGFDADMAKALGRLSFYAGAPRSFQREVEDAATRVLLPAGQFFVLEGELCPQFAVINSGSLRVFKAGENGRELTLYHVCEGQACLANLLSTILDVRSPASAIVEEPLEAFIMPADTLRRWVRDHESVRQFVFETMANRFISLMTLVEEVTFYKLDRRLADYLQRSFANEPGELTVTHDAIASELGSAREVISQLLKGFERRGAIATARGRIRLRNADILERVRQNLLDR